MSFISIILMYHGIIASDGAALSSRERGAGLYDVKVEDFRRQLELIREKRMTVPQKVTITFDDGELNNFDVAFPILQELKFPAYFFVITERVGQKGYMNWEHLKKMQESGMTIGSHGLTHQILTELSDAQIEHELKESKRILENHLQTSVDSFSVPRGFYDQRVVDIAKRIGYKEIFVSDKEPNVRGECFSRVAVMRDWSFERFQMALEGKMPAKEFLTQRLKYFLKKAFGSKNYNRLRDFLLKG